MPVPALSLVGFMEQGDAVEHLANACVAEDDSEPVLVEEWKAARDRLGDAIPRAGVPEILPIPPDHVQYIAHLSSLPWIQPILANLPNATFALVEVDQLLAFQHMISRTRSEFHCDALGRPPAMTELMHVCLPNVQAQEPLVVSGNGNSLLLRAESLNVRTQLAGHIGPGVIGIQFGISLPLVHVVRFDGRCYLHNGFHRALGARLAGATHVPCLLRDVSSFEEVGINPLGGTFSAELLTSDNPPTLGHFTQGRAHEVKMRRLARYIHVSWAEYQMAKE